jgi:AraC family transcriptional regulator, transcriptional activator of pobA
MLYFEEINDLLAYTKFPETTHLPDFHILRMGDSGENFVKMMPPYRQNFYQIGFQEQMLKTEFSLQNRQFSSLNHLLYFVAPHQVMSWVVEQQNWGFIIYFKKDFLSSFFQELETEFPFFNLYETHLLELESKHNDLIISYLQKIRTAFEQPSSQQIGILKGLLIAFLYLSKEIYTQTQQIQTEQPKPHQLAQKFQNYVQKFFIEKHKIEDYAELLHVSPNYLSAVIKEVTHRNAKEFIQERLLLEAQNLLGYTQLTISEIAYQLGFEEMTHFGRFFRQATGISPLHWRVKNKKS